MENKSIWSKEISDKYKSLDKDIHVDVLIIGGGITGISTAYHLLDSNLSVCVIEKNKIAAGVSSRTTGKLTYLQDLMYSKIEDKYNFDVSYKYYNSQIEAIKLVEGIIKNNDIECNYNRAKSYLFASNKEDIDKIKYEKDLLLKMGVKVGDVKKLPINIHNYYGISVNNTAYFHPVKYINSLANICYEKGTQIYEDTNIIKLEEINDDYICYTEKNKIFAKKVICACHYPFFILPYFFPTKAHLERSYISASKVLENKNVSGINTSKNTISFRYHSNDIDNYLIYLRNSHNLAFKYNVKDNFNDLYKDLEKLGIKADYLWTNEDIITNDYLPYIGEIKKDLYIATGYNTWGMTNGSLAGKILSDKILDKNNEYSSLFNPRRDIFFINVLYNLFSSAKPFIENKLVKNKDFYSKNVIFTKRKGHNIGIYIDEFNKEHIVYNRCPHVKCSLIFNEIEKTWDCPCHSSRFDIDGNCIKGPAKYNIKFED